jgi:diacylglycerol kinase (ATP)
MRSDKFTIKSRIRSFRFALRGLKSLLKYEHNSRIHLIAAVMSVALGIILKISFSEWSVLIIVIGMVFIAELFNSSLESLADHIDTEWNEFIMKAKDYSAAAVLISAIIALLAGCMIFLTKLLTLINFNYDK